MYIFKLSALSLEIIEIILPLMSNTPPTISSSTKTKVIV